MNHRVTGDWQVAAIKLISIDLISGQLSAIEVVIMEGACLVLLMLDGWIKYLDQSWTRSGGLILLNTNTQHQRLVNS